MPALRQGVGDPRIIQYAGRFGFRPEELRLFSLSLQFPEVSLTTAPAACAACGLVWAELDPSRLRQKLHDLGNEEVRRRLGMLDEEGDA